MDEKNAIYGRKNAVIYLYSVFEKNMPKNKNFWKNFFILQNITLILRIKKGIDSTIYRCYNGYWRKTQHNMLCITIYRKGDGINDSKNY